MCVEMLIQTSCMHVRIFVCVGGEEEVGRVRVCVNVYVCTIVFL